MEIVEKMVKVCEGKEVKKVFRQSIIFGEELKSALIERQAFTEDQLEQIFQADKTNLQQRVLVKMLTANIRSSANRSKFAKFIEALKAGSHEHTAHELQRIITEQQLQCFLLEHCKCEGQCSSLRCGCKKHGRSCSSICHMTSTVECLNGGPARQPSSGPPPAETGAASVAVVDGDAVPSSSQQQVQVNADTVKKYVLKPYSRKMRKCSSCEQPFNRTANIKFVLAHSENKVIWLKRQRTVVQSTSHYHCSASCIEANFTIAAPPDVARGLTAEDVNSLKLDGIDVSHLTSRV